MGVAKGTLMRERRQHHLQPATSSESPATTLFRRHFAPQEADIDDLAEAVRLLLDDGFPTSNLHLLSPRTRATHVMEAET